MPDIHSLHKFYEANLEGYERKDLHVVNRFFLKLLGWGDKKPMVKIFASWEDFKAFVCDDWQGDAEEEPIKRMRETTLSEGQEWISAAAQKIATKTAATSDGDRCKCGGKWVKRQNRKEGNFFLGCSRYPHCRNTRNL